MHYSAHSMAIPFWFLILLMVFAFGSIKMVHHVIFLAPIRFLFGLLLAVAAVVFIMIAKYAEQSMNRAQREAASEARITARYPSDHDIVIRENPAAAKSAPVPQPPVPDVESNVPAPITAKQTAATLPISNSSASEPDWVKHPDGHDELQGGVPVYVVTVTGYPCYTTGECDLTLMPEVDRAVTDYADREFPDLAHGTAKLDSDFVNQHLIRQRSYQVVNPKDYGKMLEEHALLVFDPEARAAVERQSRGSVVAERLQQAAVGFVAILLALGAVHSFARQKPKSVQAV
jgi:hypothetical protein